VEAGVTQLSIDFAERAIRQQGMQAALAHAERACEDWADLAYQFLLNSCRTRELIFAEDITAAAEAWGLPQPPTTRAWGGIYVRAQHERIIEATSEYRKRKNGSPAVVYRSLIWKAAA
jgi:hypothetical protein